MENTRKPIYGDIKNETCPESPTGRPHDAILIDLINVGPLTTTNQEGKKKTDHHLVWVFQVFPQNGDRQANGQPHYFTLEATTSLFPGAPETERSRAMSPSKSYVIVTGMRGPLKPGERYDFNKLIGKPCRLNIYHERGFAKLATDTEVGRRGVEPFVDEAGKFIADEKLWPKAEMEYYFPESEETIAARLTDPDRFKKRDQPDSANAPAQSRTVAAKTSDDGVVPF